MSQAPYMPLFCADYLGDTLDLTLEQHGAYLKILMISWRRGCDWLPDDDTIIARAIGTTVPRWRTKIRPAIVKFFDFSNKNWCQKRLEIEWKRMARKAQTARANGAAGGRPQSGNYNGVENPGGSSWVNPNGTQEVTQEKPTGLQRARVTSSISSKEDNQSPPTPTGGVGTQPDQFERFWQAYPSRGEAANPRKPAAQRFERAVRSGISPEVLVAAAERYADYCQREGIAGGSKVAQAITWLNQARWEQYAPPPDEQPKPQIPGFDEALTKAQAWSDWRKAAELWQLRESGDLAGAERAALAYIAETGPPSGIAAH